jgi:soluble lytic murein transglycosylase-like protein
MRSLALLIALAVASPAAAELVVFRTGRTLSVESHRVDGDSFVMTLRRGGEVVCDRSIVDRIEPDEIPYPVSEATADGAPMTGQSYGGQPSRRAMEYDPLVQALSRTHGVNPTLVHAVIAVESSYEPRARSPKGAMGLMQLMPATARQYEVRNPYDPAANIEAGTRHLRSLLDHFPLALALAAYNAGESAVQRFGGVPPFPETQAYVAKVLSLVSQ